MAYLLDSLSTPPCYCCGEPAQWRLYDAAPAYTAPDGFTRISTGLPTLFLCSNCLKGMRNQVGIITVGVATVDIVSQHFSDGADVREWNNPTSFLPDPLFDAPKRDAVDNILQQVQKERDFYSRKFALNATKILIGNLMNIVSKDSHYNFGKCHISIFDGRDKFYLILKKVNKQYGWYLTDDRKKAYFVKSRFEFQAFMDIITISKNKPPRSWWMVVVE